MTAIPPHSKHQEALFEQICALLEHNLGLKANSLARDPSTLLLGNIPELDSMAIVGVLTSLENYFGFTIYDDEINADVLETLGNLADYIESNIHK
jgi:acyl carrier protein